MLVTFYKMLTMSVDRSIVLLALCFMLVSSNVLSSRKDEQNVDNSCQDSDLCETHILSTPLGSSVLLQCYFPISMPSVKSVSWSSLPGYSNLVNLNSEGHVKFVDPRYGRVKAFPNQGSERNYSIRIDELQNSDLGCYRCERGPDCLQVELVAETGTLRGETLLLIYICAGIAAFILMTVGCYFFMKYTLCWTQFNPNNPVGAAGASAPPVERVRGPGDQQQRGADNLVYENDDHDPASQQGNPTRNHSNIPGVLSDPDWTQPTQSTSGIYPNLTQFNFERMESQRKKMRFHSELFNRLRQASLSRHYYVNQGELNRQQAMTTQAENHRRGGLGKKKAKENCDYKNPIYNRSTDQLNNL